RRAQQFLEGRFSWSPQRHPSKFRNSTTISLYWLSPVGHTERERLRCRRAMPTAIPLLVQRSRSARCLHTTSAIGPYCPTSDFGAKQIPKERAFVSAFDPKPTLARVPRLTNPRRLLARDGH